MTVRKVPTPVQPAIKQDSIAAPIKWHVLQRHPYKESSVLHKNPPKSIVQIDVPDISDLDRSKSEIDIYVNAMDSDSMCLFHIGFFPSEADTN